MFFLAVYILLFAVLAFLSFLDKNKGNLDTEIYWGAGFVLFCLAAFKPLGIDNDGMAYVASYYGQSGTSLDENMEMSFYLISDLIRYTIDIPEAVFLVYALLAIPLKLYSLQKLSPLWYLSLIVLMGHYFLLHDVTQIRANVVTAIFLFSLLFLAEGRRLVYVGMILLAALFHISALALLPLVIFSNRPLSNRWLVFLALVPVAGYAMFFLKIDVVVFSLIPYIQDKIELYEKIRDQGGLGTDINVFDKMFLIKLLVFYFLLWKYNVIKEHCKYAPLLMKIYPLYFAAFCSLGFLPVLASRISDLYGVVQIVTIPLACYTVKPSWVGKSGVCAVAVLLLFFSIFYMNLLTLNS